MTETETQKQRKNRHTLPRKSTRENENPRSPQCKFGVGSAIGHKCAYFTREGIAFGGISGLVACSCSQGFSSARSAPQHNLASSFVKIHVRVLKKIKTDKAAQNRKLNRNILTGILIEGPKQCFYCKKLGHFIADCRKWIF
jgi:hypothetical protein